MEINNFHQDSLLLTLPPSHIKSLTTLNLFEKSSFSFYKNSTSKEASFLVYSLYPETQDILQKSLFTLIEFMSTPNKNLLNPLFIALSNNKLQFPFQSQTLLNTLTRYESCMLITLKEGYSLGCFLERYSKVNFGFQVPTQYYHLELFLKPMFSTLSGTPIDADRNLKKIILNIKNV